MKFSPLNTEINIVSSSYNFQIIVFLLSLNNWFKNKVKFFHQILLYNHIKLWRQEFTLVLKSEILVNKSSKKLHEDIKINSNNSTIKGENFMKIG